MDVVLRVIDGTITAPDFRRAESAHLAQWFENLPTPGFFLRQDTLEVVDPNANALVLLSTSKSLSMVNGRLVLAGKGMIERFRATLRDLLSAPAAHALEVEGGGYMVLRLERVGDTGVVSVLVFPPQAATDFWADTMDVFGLTPAEDRLVKRLMTGANIEEVSADLGISVETARTHVRRSYLKIGVSNREQLFAALTPFRIMA